jgi:hypothetical protein
MKYVFLQILLAMCGQYKGDKKSSKEASVWILYARF